MSRVRDLPEITTLENADLFYAVDASVGPNGGRKITRENLKESIALTAAEVKTRYESNPDTNAFTDAEQALVATVPNKLNKAGDTMSGDLDMNSNQILNLPTPTLDAEAATKLYVDSTEDALSFKNSVLDKDLVAPSGSPTVGDRYIVAAPAGGLWFGHDRDIAEYHSGGWVFITPSNGDTVHVIDEDKYYKFRSTGPVWELIDLVIDHGNLQGLTDDDHLQYLNRSGVRPMTGTLDMGTNAITNNTTINSVSITAHSTRHNVGGADALTTAAPTTNLGLNSTNASGTPTAFAPNTHTHAFNTAQAGDLTTVMAGDTEILGSTNRFIDAGHQHPVATAVVSAITPNLSNSEGVSTSLTRADHIHNIATAAPTTNLGLNSTNAQGTPTAFAPNTHTHAFNAAQAGDLSTINAGDAEVLGSSNRFVDAAHQHPVATAAAISITPDQANAEGASTSLARANHVHNIATAAPTTNLSTTSTNASGTPTAFAPNTHTHAFNMATGGDLSTINAGDTETLGSTTRFVDAGHQHPVATAAAVQLLPDQANAEGASTSLARANHIHNIPSGTPTDTGTANSAGSAASFALSNHVHKTVIQNYSATQTTSTTTTSTTDVLMTGMQIVNPIAGDYFVNFNASMLNSANGAERNYCSIYVGGVQQAFSEVRVGIAGGATAAVSAGAKVTVNGSQNIEVYWRVIGGTGTVHQRGLRAMKVG